MTNIPTWIFTAFFLVYPTCTALIFRRSFKKSIPALIRVGRVVCPVVPTVRKGLFTPELFAAEALAGGLMVPGVILLLVLNLKGSDEDLTNMIGIGILFGGFICLFTTFLIVRSLSEEIANDGQDTVRSSVVKD